MNAFHVSVFRWTLATLVIFGVLRRSESFSFTRKPANPTVVVEGVNSTQVELVWNFTATASFGIVIKRERLDGSQQIQIASLADSAPTFIIPDNFKADYEANLPATLVIKNVTRNDEYKYTISVIDTGFVEKLFDEVTVDVLFPAKITNISDDQTVREGTSLQLFCEASGKPAPNITWTKVLEDGSNSEVQRQGPTLDFSNISRTASGTYRCTASNGIGNPVSQKVTVNVLYPPKVVKLAIEHEVAAQQGVSLHCQAEGNPQPTYTWTPCDPQNSVCDESTLHIAKALSDGFYSCQVTNVLGTDTRYTIVFIASNVINVTLVITSERCTDGRYNQLWRKLNETVTNVSGSPVLKSFEICTLTAVGYNNYVAYCNSDLSWRSLLK